MSVEALQDNYGHHHLMDGAANAITSKPPQVLVVETVVDLKVLGKKGKKPNDYLVGVAGFEPATPASRTLLLCRISMKKLYFSCCSHAIIPLRS
jgi:hypothetical protein